MVPHDKWLPTGTGMEISDFGEWVPCEDLEELSKENELLKQELAECKDQLAFSQKYIDELTDQIANLKEALDDQKAMNAWAKDDTEKLRAELEESHAEFIRIEESWETTTTSNMDLTHKNMKLEEALAGILDIVRDLKIMGASPDELTATIFWPEYWNHRIKQAEKILGVQDA